MRPLRTARKRGLLCVLAVSALVIGVLVTLASAAGPGGWDHLGDRGTPGTDSLDLVASALAVTPGALYVGGEFTDAGGVPDADRIATWNGSSWSAVSSSTSQISNGRVSAIAVSAGKVYAGGTFQNAGGDADADFLAVWDGTSWEPFCDAAGPAFTGNVTSLQIVGQTLYVGGAFQNGAGIASADYLLACDLATGASSSTVVDPAHPFSGSVYALAADSNGTLYAGGGFTNLENIPAADNVAYLPAGGTWQPMGAGAGPCGCAVTTLRPRSHRRRDRRVRRHGRERRRGHRAGRPRRALERVGVERPGRRQRRRERVVPDDHLDQRPGRHRLVPLRHRDVPERERRRARRQRRLLRRHRLAPGRVRRRRQRPVERHRPRARARRPPALCGRELHQRRRRPPGALRRLVRAHADHRLSDAHGDRGPGPGPDAHGDAQPRRRLRRA